MVSLTGTRVLLKCPSLIAQGVLMGATNVARWVKLLPKMLDFHIRELVQVLPVPLLIQFYVNVCRKAAENGPSTWASDTQMGDLDSLLVSWFH